MTKKSLIKHTLSVLEKLPKDKAIEVADFADYIFKKYDESVIQKGINTITQNAKPYAFLEEEEELYSVSDLKEKYK